MKISAIPATGIPAAGAAQGAPQIQPQNIRSLRMSTNATPGHVETPPLSTPDTDEPVADEVTQPLSPQLAALARQRRALQVKEREIADREKALSTQAPTQGDLVSKARLKSDPVGVFLESGLTYDELAQAIMANDANSPVKALEAKIKALEEGLDKKLTDRDSQSEQQVLAEMRREATQLTAEGDAFEMVRETRSVPQVMKLIERTYRETGEVLDVREALKLVEDELVKDGMRLAGLQKVQSQIVPRPAPQAPQQRQMRTLTNRDTAQVPMSAKQRALAAFAGTLKR